MATLTISLALPPDRAEAWRRFCQQLDGERRESFSWMCRRLGVRAARLSLASAEAGMAVFLTLEADDIGRTLSALALSKRPFERWFRDQLHYLHGFYLAERVAPVAAETFYDWRDLQCGSRRPLL